MDDTHQKDDKKDGTAPGKENKGDNHWSPGSDGNKKPE